VLSRIAWRNGHAQARTNQRPPSTGPLAQARSPPAKPPDSRPRSGGHRAGGASYAWLRVFSRSGRSVRASMPLIHHTPQGSIVPATQAAAPAAEDQPLANSAESDGRRQSASGSPAVPGRRWEDVCPQGGGTIRQGAGGQGPWWGLSAQQPAAIGENTRPPPTPSQAREVPPASSPAEIRAEAPTHDWGHRALVVHCSRIHHPPSPSTRWRLDSTADFGQANLADGHRRFASRSTRGRAEGSSGFLRLLHRARPPHNPCRWASTNAPRWSPGWRHALRRSSGRIAIVAPAQWRRARVLALGAVSTYGPCVLAALPPGLPALGTTALATDWLGGQAMGGAWGIPALREAAVSPLAGQQLVLPAALRPIWLDGRPGGRKRVAVPSFWRQASLLQPRQRAARIFVVSLVPGGVRCRSTPAYDSFAASADRHWQSTCAASLKGS